MSDDPFDTDEWRDIAEDAKKRLEPMVRDSAVCMSIYNGKLDPKMAMETGYMIMLDKPIIAVVSKNTRLPLKFAKVCDEIVEGEITDPDLADRIKAAMARITLRGEADD